MGVAEINGVELKAIQPEDADFAKQMLERIAFVRAFETKALALSKTTPPAIVGSMHLCAGQESVPVAALASLRATDKVISTYRGHGWALAAGVDATALMGELCHRANGVNEGRGGSAYFMSAENRFFGENSIVGAGVPIACGVAMAEVSAESGNVVIVSIGDGAMNQGAVHEALVFAAYKQLPVIVVCENNGWSELTPTGEIAKVERLARRSVSYGIEGITIDGTDPMLVRDTIAAAAARARAGSGPTLVECKVPRLWGHYNRDIEHYRPKADKDEAARRDPLKVLGQRLVASRVMNEQQVEGVLAAAEAKVNALSEVVLATGLAPTACATQHVTVSDLGAARPSKGAVKTEELSYIVAVRAALRDELESDPRTVVYGEDVGFAGGIFGGSKDLQKDFGKARVFDTPIAEAAILGSAVGAAMGGMKPIVEIMWADFMLVALDQMVNQAANVRYLSGGKTTASMVMRTQQGATPGSCAQHSQCLEALLTHIPGLNVAMASTPQDAYSLLREAAANPDPCIVIEARGLYQIKGDVTRNEPVQPIGQAKVHREGSDVAIVTWGAMLHQAVAAADLLAEKGIRAAVIDLRWLTPLDEKSLLRLVHQCQGRVLIVHEAVRTGGFGAEVAMRIGELAGRSLQLQVRRLTTPDVRIPAAPHLQAALIPDAKLIANAAEDMHARLI